MYPDAHVSPSSFTPINRPGAQALSPLPSPYLPSSKQEDAVNNDRAKLHHPVIADYLGLGAEREPAHLEKYAPFLPPTPTTPPKVLKRSRKVHDDIRPQKDRCLSKPERSKLRQASDEHRVTSRTVRRSARNIENSTPFNVSTAWPSNSKNGIDSNEEGAAQVRHPRIEKGPVKLSNCNTSTTLTQALPNHAVSSSSLPRLCVPSNAISETPIDVQNNCVIDDEFSDDDDLFDSIDINSATGQCATNAEHSGAQKIADLPGGQTNPEHMGSPVTMCDDEYLSLSTPDLADDFALSPFQLNVVDHEPESSVIVNDSLKLAVSTSSSKSEGPARKLKSPVTEKTEALVRSNVQEANTTNRRPIIRALFPDPVRDRSPIIGLSANTLLRTCFRIGEIINQAGLAARNGQSIIFELYARVRSSQRDAIKQHFLFSDLYHERPPYLKGEYDATLWKPVELFNYDSGRFLSKANMCRCIGQMKKNNKEWVMVILNIWEATWEDVEWVEGIVNS